MPNNIVPVVVAMFNTLNTPKDALLIPGEHFTHCFDLKNFALAPVALQVGAGIGGYTTTYATGGGYIARCGTETTIICYEPQVMGWFKDRGMSHRNALGLLVAVNARNANRYV